MASWYYLSNGQQVGPVDLEALRRLISAGQISPADLVWSDGMANWLPVTSVPEVADLAAPQPGAYGVALPPYAAPNSYAANFPGTQGYSVPYSSAPPRGNGTTAVGIISIIWGGLFVLCAGLAVIAVLSLPQSRAGAIGPVDRLVAFVGLALHLCLAISGVGTLMRKQWARALVWVVAGPLIALYLFNLFNALSKHQPQVTQANEGGFYCGLVFTVGLGISWLLFLIWFYQRPAVKQEFESASAPGGPGTQGGTYRY